MLEARARRETFNATQKGKDIKSPKDQALQFYLSDMAVLDIAKAMKKSERTIWRWIRTTDKSEKKTPPINDCAGREGEGAKRTAKGQLSQQTDGPVVHKVTYRPEPYGLNKYVPFIMGEMSFEENDALTVADSYSLDRAVAIIIAYLRNDTVQDKNLCLEEQHLKSGISEFLRQNAAENKQNIVPDDATIECAVKILVQAGLVVTVSSGDKIYLYLRHNYDLEHELAQRIKNMCGVNRLSIKIADELKMALGETNQVLSLDQQEAIRSALTYKFSVITGGAGCGKTTVISALCRIIRRMNPSVRIKLCAPTGKAANHLEQKVGITATTIHCLLGKRRLKGKPDRLIDCDCIIIDETSMMDAELFLNLLRFLNPEASVLLVGDPNQLPCVGLGFPMRDLILSGTIPVARLKQTHRQSDGSQIVTVANKMLCPRDTKSLVNDLMCMDSEVSFIEVHSLHEVQERAAETFIDTHEKNGVDIRDIQLISPTRATAETINTLCQNLVHSTSGGYKVGDRVMYTINNFKVGLYNGSVGVVTSTSAFDECIEVKYNSKTVRHDKKDQENVKLAYNITVHKAQGSEYPVVIIAIHESMGRVLSKQLIYTAITRAREKCIIVGTKAALTMALTRDMSENHISLLAEMLKSGK